MHELLGSRNCQDELKIIFNSLVDVWEDGLLIFLDVHSSSFRNQLNQHFTARTSCPQLDIGFLLINFYLYEVVTFSFVFTMVFLRFLLSIGYPTDYLVVRARFLINSS